MQAVIYDGNTRDAKLMGVEYIISERLFNTLPPDEKKLWHSHRHEVMSGSLIGPGLPKPAEKALMSKIVNTYGKTWHTWHTDRDKTLPLGIPALMMGFTADGRLMVSSIPRYLPNAIVFSMWIPGLSASHAAIWMRILSHRALMPGSTER